MLVNQTILYPLKENVQKPPEALKIPYVRFLRYSKLKNWKIKVLLSSHAGSRNGSSLTKSFDPPKLLSNLNRVSDLDYNRCFLYKNPKKPNAMRLSVGSIDPAL